jgi:hypothetical protein
MYFIYKLLLLGFTIIFREYIYICYSKKEIRKKKKHKPYPNRPTRGPTPNPSARPGSSRWPPPPASSPSAATHSLLFPLSARAQLAPGSGHPPCAVGYSPAPMLPPDLPSRWFGTVALRLHTWSSASSPPQAHTVAIAPLASSANGPTNLGSSLCPSLPTPTIKVHSFAGPNVALSTLRRHPRTPPRLRVASAAPPPGPPLPRRCVALLRLRSGRLTGGCAAMGSGKRRQPQPPTWIVASAAEMQRQGARGNDVMNLPSQLSFALLSLLHYSRTCFCEFFLNTMHQ